MQRTPIPLLLILFAVLALAGSAEAQGGYSREKAPEHGLTFELARNYEWLATQPNEKWVVLQWVEEDRANRRKKNELVSRYTPRMQIVRIDYVSDPAPVTTGGEKPEGESSADGEKPKEEKPEEKEPLPINSWQRYAERVLHAWEPLEVGPGKPRDGYESMEYELRRKRGNAKLRGWAYVWHNPRVRTFVVLGWCGDVHYDDQTKIWRHCAEKMRFSEPEPDPEVEKLQRYYERRSKLKDPDYRIRVRRSLGGDWKHEDTENYIIIYNTRDQPLVRRIVSDMESIRKEYERLFPPVAEVEAVSTVRICADRDEYLQYGGPDGSAGYWNYVTEELVLYDGTKREKGKRTDKLDTFIVLYHEAFHQYIHYSAGQLGLHYWYNEGFGDFFSGAQIKGGKVRRIGVNRWRVNTIQRMIQEQKFVPWKEMIEYERAQYYGPNAGLNYAQGWSMVFFLNTCKEVEKSEEWAAILPTYFDEVKRRWAIEKAELEEAGKDEDDEAVEAGMLKARQGALAEAFDGVNIDELQAAWAEYILDLESVER